LTLDAIFQAPPDLGGADLAQLRVLVATGDIIPARSTNAKVLQRHDFLYPYRPTVDYLRSADLLFVNLEAPLLARCPVTLEGLRFCGDARHVEGLVFARVGVANLANNHLADYGPAGTQETIDLLKRNSIAPVGLGLWEIREIRGLKFAFIGFNGVGTSIDRAEVARQIAIVRPQADVLVVAYHWGKEYESLPQSTAGLAPDDPRAVAHWTIEAGADLIIGNHPHWVQGVEIYRGGFIAYAHGNFIFDQMWSRETREGVVGRYTFYGKQLAMVEYRPVLIEDYAQPRFLDGEDRARIVTRMEESSRRMAGPTPAPPPTRTPRTPQHT
jgi:poly-gamma-glutamate synthesis protein (capsule biosynthesis protein)